MTLRQLRKDYAACLESVKGQEMIEVYTDGSCHPNPNGHGGWAWVSFWPCGNEQRGSGYVPGTTNNRMELMAVLMALETLPLDRSVIIHSDSLVVLNWMKGYAHALKPSAPHPDLRMRLRAAIYKRNKQNARTIGHKVLGHSGVPGNELADLLANKARLSLGVKDGSNISGVVGV